LIGTFLDKYEVLQKIGEGGMATVYRARHTTLGREVAIKILHPHLSAVARNRRRFAREARAIEHLDHENILKIFDYSGSDAEDCYIVTEFVEGQTLRQLIEARGLLPSEVAAFIGIKLADALRYAHEAGIIHRDLKPENVMLRVDGTVKLMDFGIARFLDESSVTMTGALVGSPAYMSPEQALERKLDARSDLFSLGTLLYHLVTGQLPYAGSNPSIILRNIIEGVRREVLDVQPGVAPKLADVINRLLELEPDARYDSAEAVAIALAAVLDEVELTPEADWSLIRYLVAADDYEERLRDHLDEVLLDQGRSALRTGDHLVAQRMFNRLLAQDPHHEEVLTLLSDLHQHGPDDGDHARALTGLGGGLAVLAIGVAAWWWMVPPDDLGLVGTESVARVPPPIAARGTMDPEELILAPEPRVTQVARPIAALPPKSLPVRTTTDDLGYPVAVAEPDQEPAEVLEPVADEPATLVITLGRKSYANVYIDGVEVGQVPFKPRYRVEAGPHELRLGGPAVEDFVRAFTAEAGGVVEFKGVLLERKPVRVVVPESYPPDCLVQRDGVDLGTLQQSGYRLPLRTQEEDSKLELWCPDGTVETVTIGPKDAGSSVYVPAPP